MRRDHAVRTAALWGRDHDRLGPVVDAGLSDADALALSCGARPKPYATVDPNEDVLFSALGPGGAILAVVDGSGGMEAAEAAVTAMMRATHARLAGREPPDVVAMDVFTAAGHGVQRMRALVPEPRRSSRAAFSVVVADGEAAAAATRGDTAVVLVRGGRVRVLSGAAPSDHPPPTLPLPQRAQTRAGDTLMVASDGFFDYAGRGWAAAVVGALDGAGDLRAAARRLVGLACARGAGDNVSVGLLRLPAGS